MAKKALIIDGNSIIYRAFYATHNQLEYYKLHNMQPLNALKLVLLMYLKLVGENKYDYVVFAIDMGKKTFRHDQYEQYKAKRKPMPEDLVSQLPLIKQALTDIGTTIYGIEKIEADDIIGSFATMLNNFGVAVDIYSSDKDLLQLVNNQTTIHLIKSGLKDVVSITPESFPTLFPGLIPEQIPDFKGISGDSSDNIQGIKGVGPKTTFDLLTKYKTLENIYNNLEQLNLSVKTKFIDNKEQALLCKQLCTIKRDVFMTDFNLDSILANPINWKQLKSWVDRYHFSGFDKYFVGKNLDDSLF